MRTKQRFPFLSDKPVSEDTYYMLTVAWNIAQGKGVTYNFGKPTTGIQPISTFIYAGLAWITQIGGWGKWGLVRVALFQGAISLLILAFIISKIARTISIGDPLFKQWTSTFAFVLTLFNFGLFRIVTYGLETGLFLIMISTCILFSILKLPSNVTNKKELSRTILFSILCGFTILVRLDFIFVLGCLLVFAFFKKRLTVVQAFLIVIISAIIVSPWIFYVYTTTGTFIPSSGLAQIRFISLDSLSERFISLYRSILLHLIPWIYSRPDILLSLVASVFLFSLIVFFTRSQGLRNYFREMFNQQKWLANWLVSLLILALIYFIGFFAVYFYHRYTSPLVTILIPLLACSLTYLTKNLSNIFKIGIIVSLVFFFLIWAGIALHTGVVSNTQAVTAGFIQQKYPSTKVGAFQSGVIGYFNPSVVNLDGKVNHEVLGYLRQKSLGSYLDNEQIDVLVDWSEVIDRYLSDQYLIKNWESCNSEIADGKTLCLRRTYP